MAENNTIKELNKDYQNQRIALRETTQRIQRKCRHKACDNAQVKFIKDSKVNIPNRKDLPDTTIVCDSCKRYFESESYSPDELDSAAYMFMSMLEQIKMLSELSKEDEEFIQSGYESIENLTTIANYYNNMAEKLMSNKKQRNNNSGNNKGHMGLNSSMFGGRSY